MSTKKKAASTSAPRRRREDHTIAVRFATDTSGKIYTYVVAKRANVLLGEELVVDSPRGPALVFVVRKDTGIVRPEDFSGELKRVNRRVRPL